MFFAPTTSPTSVNGQLSFGGTDQSLFVDPLTTMWVVRNIPLLKLIPCPSSPLTTTFPSNFYVGIDQTITYDGQPILTSAGIVDTGTTLLLIASGKPFCTSHQGTQLKRLLIDALALYMAATGATYNTVNGFLQITPDQFGKLQSLFFEIGGVSASCRLVEVSVCSRGSTFKS